MGWQNKYVIVKCEFEHFIKYVKEYHLVNFFCSNESCNCIFYCNDELYFDFDENMNVQFSLVEYKVCLFCNADNFIRKTLQKKIDNL